MPADDDRKVKDVLAGEAIDQAIEPATAADLARWFGLPSFQELEERGVTVEDPEVVAARERRERATAAVDPAMLEAHRRRVEPPDDLIKFKPVLEPVVDPGVALFDIAMVEHAIAEPREVEIPEALVDDLKICTPQALLRDLHRPELHFEKTFEVIDFAAEQRLDAVALVDELMATSWKPSVFIGSAIREARATMESVRAERRRPWPELLAAQPLPNRRWVQDR